MNVFRTKKSLDFCTLSMNEKGIAFAYLSKTVEGGKALIQELEFFPYPAPAPSDETVLQMLKKISDRYPIIVRVSCSFILSPENYRLLLMAVPANLQHDEILPSLPWLIKDLVDMPIEATATDFFLLPKAPQDEEQKMSVVIAQRWLLKKVQEQVISAGFSLDYIDITELALHYLLQHGQETTQGSAVLLVRPQHSLLCISHDNKLYFTRTLDVKLGNNGEANHAFASQLATEVQSSLDYYHSQVGQEMPANVLLAPSTLLSSQFVEQFSHGLTVATTKLLELPQLLHFKDAPRMELQADCLLAIAGSLRMQGEEG